MRIRSRAASAIASAAVAAVLAACSSVPDSPSGSESADGADGLAVSHVHGLGIDPANERLYVATHEGVIAVADDGTAQRVGDKADYTGFTVIGPKTFLGSGHPAEDSGDHGNRGLLQSTDSGKTWKTLSLGGTTDFHSLEFAHGTVCGYDSTRGVLRVSTDRTTWDSRAELGAPDIAVGPEGQGERSDGPRRHEPERRAAPRHSGAVGAGPSLDPQNSRRVRCRRSVVADPPVSGRCRVCDGGDPGFGASRKALPRPGGYGGPAAGLGQGVHVRRGNGVRGVRDVAGSGDRLEVRRIGRAEVAGGGVSGDAVMGGGMGERVDDAEADQEQAEQQQARQEAPRRSGRPRHVAAPRPPAGGTWVPMARRAAPAGRTVERNSSVTARTSPASQARAISRLPVSSKPGVSAASVSTRPGP